MGAVLTVASFLTGSKTGRYVALGILIIGGAVFLYFMIKAKGYDQAQAEQAAASLNNIRSRMISDDEIASLDRPGRRELMRGWASG